ncbi:MAG: tetratricopeptide repeat protein [Candidatus Acidiferrales bacterium]
MRRLKVFSTLSVTIVLCFAGTLRAQTPLEAARSLFDQGHYTEAQALLHTETAKTPQRAILYYWLGRCAYELHDNDKAVNNAERAVELEPEIASYHHFLARAYGHKAEYANWFSGLSLARKASHEFLEAVQIDPNNVRFERDLISFYIRAPGIAGGGEEKAEAQIARLSAIDAVQGHLAKMEIFEEKKKWNLAAEEAKAVLAAIPKEAGPYLEVAEYYESHADATGIRNALAAIPQNAPADSRIHFYRGVADILAGDRLEEAETSLNSYLANLPQRREDHASRSASHRWLGRMYEKMGRRDSAADEYRMAIQLDPNDKAAHEGLRRMGS